MGEFMTSNMQIAGYTFDQELFLIWTEKLAIITLILVVTWGLAKAAKWAFARMIDQISFFRRGTSSGESVGMALGRIVSLFIWLFGLLAILQRLGFDSMITPVQGLLTNFIGYVDNIVFAAAIFFIGSMIARIVRDIVETALATVNLDKWANMGGLEAVTGNSAISKTIGTIVYVLIIIPVAIAALQMLEISAITDPAMSLLNTVFKAVPFVICACLLLGLGYVISRWISGLIGDLLPSLGADRAIAELGILPEGRSASGVIATIVSIAIMVFFAIAATKLLGFPQLTSILQTVLAQAGNVVFGAVLIALGVIVARILQSLVTDTTGAGIAPNIAYWLTVALFIFIGLQQMNIGGPIIEYAFGALAIGASVAFALAFGLGGRDAAAKMLANFGSTKPTTPQAPAKMTADLVSRAAEPAKPAPKPRPKPAAKLTAKRK
jgi:Conserved TM helix